MKHFIVHRGVVAAAGAAFLFCSAAGSQRGFSQSVSGTSLQVGLPTSGLGTLQLATPLPRYDTSGGGSPGFSPAVTPAVSILVPVNTGTPFTINLNVGPTLAANPAALGAFKRAAGAWTSTFRDPVTVNINADLALLPSNVIGSTSSVFLVGDYTTVRDAMVDDATNDPGDGIVNALPTAAQFSAFLPSNSGITLSGGVESTKANFKAQGFTDLDALFGDTDASITFSTLFPFDFDNSNGVGPNLIDFQTVATHEIGHALGFESSVDVVDFALSNHLTGQLDFDALDMFRFGFNHDNPTTMADFTNNPRDFLTGDEAVTDDLAHEYRMSTGVVTGDGHQASHWKDDQILGPPYIGIMDPTLNFSSFETIQPSDVRALDLIGWDVVAPLPPALWGGMALLGALGAKGWIGRRKVARG